MYKTTIFVPKTIGFAGTLETIARQIDEYLNTDPLPNHSLISVASQDVGYIFFWRKNESPEKYGSL